MTTQTVTYRCPHCQQPVEVDVNPDNEVLVCPREGCQKPFKVDVPTAERVSELVLPPGAHREQETAEPAQTVAQPPSKDVPEETLRVLSLSLWRRYPLRCAVYFLLVAGTALGALLYSASGWTFGAIVCLAASGFVATRFVMWWLKTRNTTFTITNKRCVLQRGVFTKETIDVPLAEIQDIQINQNWGQGVLDVGDLILVTRKENLQRIAIMALRSPKEVAELLREQQQRVVEGRPPATA